ncbi:alpha/beta fold hydrolase [Rhodococcus hoagii]|nr:alpha/beta fold hydrolase [Prescottella equi]
MADTEITFTTGAITLHGSLRLPAGSGPDAPAPAVLLLAGSGPTDRNGDSALLPGSIGTLEFLADLLERHGFASLRYDKLGSGSTGLGPYELEDIGDLGFSVFTDAAAAALTFLSDRAAVDPERVYVVGHSEGALIALALADSGAKVAGLGLLEPLAVRLLDLLTTQIDGQLTAVVGAGQLPVELADELRVALAGAVESLRSDATLTDDLPDPLRAAGPRSCQCASTRGGGRARPARAGLAPACGSAGRDQLLGEGHPAQQQRRRRARRRTRSHRADSGAHDDREPRAQGDRRRPLHRCGLCRTVALVDRVHPGFRGLAPQPLIPF